MAEKERSDKKVIALSRSKWKEFPSKCREAEILTGNWSKFSNWKKQNKVVVWTWAGRLQQRPRANSIWGREGSPEEGFDTCYLWRATPRGGWGSYTILLGRWIKEEASLRIIPKKFSSQDHLPLSFFNSWLHLLAPRERGRENASNKIKISFSL